MSWRKGTFLTTAAFATVGIVGGALADDPPFDDNFDSYNTGPLTPQTSDWEPWCPGGPDGEVSTNQANSAPNSYRQFGTTTSNDTVHLIDATSGTWEISCMIFHPSFGDGVLGGTYFIVLNQYANNSCGGTHGTTNNWSAQVLMDTSLETIQSQNGGNAGGTNHGPLPMVIDQWVPFQLIVDLDNDLASMFYNGDPLITDYTWSQGVSGGGNATIRCLDLFITLGTIYWDDIHVGPIDTGGPVCPDTSTWVNNSSSSGSGNECGSDNAYYQARREAFAPNASALLTNRSHYTVSTAGGITSLTASAECGLDNNPTNPVRGRLVVKNQVGGADRASTLVPLSTTDSVITVVINDVPADFVGANGEVDVDLVFVQTSGGPNWNGRIDDQTVEVQ